MPNILVIDSDPLQRATLGQGLASLGEVEIAGTGLDALRLLATKKFSVVILDLHVRPLDGFVILRTLSAKGGPNKETPVYALAADVAERERALREHAVFALIKPLSISTVKILVVAALTRPPPAPARDEEALRRPPTPPPCGGSARLVPRRWDPPPSSQGEPALAPGFARSARHERPPPGAGQPACRGEIEGGEWRTGASPGSAIVTAKNRSLSRCPRRGGRCRHPSPDVGVRRSSCRRRAPRCRAGTARRGTAGRRPSARRCPEHGAVGVAVGHGVAPKHQPLVMPLVPVRFVMA